MPFRASWWVCGLLLCGAVSPLRMRAQDPVRTVLGSPTRQTPEVAYTGQRMPLLSLDTIHFLEGTWSATSRDGKTNLGNYRFVRELNGHVLSRESTVDPNCDRVKQPACGRRDLFYVYQDSAGAPLQAITFDNEGHVIRYFVYLAVQGSTSTLGQRDFVVFDSDPSQLGPRVRLRYEHTVDTVTGKDSLSGAFEMLQPNGTWLDLQQWFGTRQ